MELLPCPFCGATASLLTDDWGCVCVTCDNVDCFCMLGVGFDCDGVPDYIFDNSIEAIKAWNTRQVRE